VPQTRRQRLWFLGASAVVAAAVVVIAIAVGGAGGDKAGTTTGKPEGDAATRALFGGIPERGLELGSPGATVTVTEFADLQCPFCGESARDEWPGVIRRYVRPGRVRMVYRPLAFLGPDSLRAARMAAAAALQDKLWSFAYLVFRNQGEENSGWVTDAYLRRVATAAGLDVARAFRDRLSPAATALLAQTKAAAKAVGVSSTPTYLVARAGRKPKLLEGEGGLAAAIDDALK
jgi:protein-disulfide isomerase